MACNGIFFFFKEEGSRGHPYVSGPYWGSCDTLLPFLFEQHIFFPSKRAIRLFRWDCAFHSDPVTESRSNI